MLQFVNCGLDRGDGTSYYEVVIDQDYTVQTFIKAVLFNNVMWERKDEYGHIGIDDGHTTLGNPYCEYKYNSLQSEMNSDILGKCVISVRADKHLGCRNYLLKV